MPTVPRLEGPHFSLLPLVPEHAEDYIRLINHPDIGVHLSHPLPFRQPHYDEIMKRVEAGKLYSWVVVQNDTIQGVVNVSVNRATSFQSSYFLAPALRRQGIMAAALPLVHDFLAQQTSEVIRIQSMVEPGNNASWALLEKVKYEREACLRHYYFSPARGLMDVYMYSLIRNEA